MRHGDSRPAPGVNTSSMADVAFLLLTFFLVTTQINNDKGLSIVLPPYMSISTVVDVHDRNLFKIQINSSDQLLVENSPRADLAGVREEIKAFVLNFGRDAGSSENPVKAIVSLKTDRGTSHRAFVAALDEIQAAYYEIYGERAGLSSKEFRNLDLSVPTDKVLYDKGRNGIPMNISIADPTSVRQPVK